ncbi:SRPBCC domain-containing protein [Bacillus sp. 31A1R]|uniref:SRPBCC domain-containing protein n=1 Tax=Robertmurraya mangrovi TaxID=3098077 RepID=A0ABU5ITE7_9BACI|nr:SRPBCC domain-containing protein [Bacillus sp. 31A1R]MDZ5470425.1 SRPBCC domain-containing protein [Bacillus sp. 31A1R]
MRIEDSFLLHASKEDIWNLFMNVEKLGSCVPGCENVKALSPTEYTAKMEVKVQFMKFNYEAKGKMKNIVENESIEVEMNGKPLSSLAGPFQNNILIKLEEVEPRKVKIHYIMDAQAEGKLASLGDVLMKGSIQKTADQFSENVQKLFVGENV